MGTVSGRPIWSHILFHFECKYGSKTHKPFKHAHLNTLAGTTALPYSAEECDWECGVLITTNQTKPSKAFSPAFHHALLALWGAHSHCSFDLLTDKFHQQEVEYLCLGTKVPSCVRLSHNIKLIHMQFVPKIREYFAVSN
ncbi:hypothetical protein B0J17DRAFT_584578 [Rhizoctonia solani]|nr:hypothetical protein B0J17DRAFT_584578 [Rhizoctonia solani]